MLLPLSDTRAFRLTALVMLVASLFVVSPTPTSAGAPAEGAATRWQWPLGGVRMLVRPYIAPPTPYGAGHRGIDIGGAPASRVSAPDDGVVHFVGVVVDRPVLSIRHAGGLLSSYEPVVSELKAGDHVRRGVAVGVLEDGHCPTPCLHFGVRLDGEYLSPLMFLGGVPPSVLLPTRAITASRP